MKRKTLTLLALIPVSCAALILDALEPGQGVFYNPVFWIRSQISNLDTAWRELKPLDTTDPRLKPCVQLTSENILSESQEQVRLIITGKSDSFALQQLGAPTCALAGNTYRWLSKSGLVVDVTIEDGEVIDAKLSR